MQDSDELSSSQRRRSQLPPLAPRHPQSSPRSRPSGAGTSRPPRLSHRSRAGCWTCRARKVKCDEVHPKCGPCTRLNRECDWDHRWNFSDATNSTQLKYSNVRTEGNAVWDPEVRRSSSNSPAPRHYDELPAFQALTTDEERERKAETRRPGTFGVVVTPDSFSELPEYAATASSPGSRRMSVQSHASSFMTQTPPPGRLLTRTRTDPNVVVLDRFEDVSPISVIAQGLPSPARRASLPNNLQYTTIPSMHAGSHLLSSSFPPSSRATSEDNFVSHFRRHVSRRLLQPDTDDPTDMISPGSTRDAFEIESTNFPPLYHAICALSALDLAYRGVSTIEEALEHYSQALLDQTSVPNTEELLSGGAFLRHFLLFIYDICIPMSEDSGHANMWTIHLGHLQRFALLRHEQFSGHDPYGYLLWRICELDMSACLMGSGQCDFIRTILRNNMLPPLDQQVPLVAAPLSGDYFMEELSTYQDILALNQAIVIQTAKLAQMAQTFRNDAAESPHFAPGTIARWQASVAQLQNELKSLWTQRYPPYLNPNNPTAAEKLPARIGYVLEHARILYHSAMIYSRTSMFPGQRRIPVANQNEIHADTENRILSIISIATRQLEDGHLERRHTIFPLFIAGFATTQPDVKIQALDLMKTYEGSGIGQNTHRTRQLLATVYEEQRRRANEGGRMEDVDWLSIAKERSLMVVNCGL